jgi:hypothetical protein
MNMIGTVSVTDVIKLLVDFPKPVRKIKLQANNDDNTGVEIYYFKSSNYKDSFNIKGAKPGISITFPTGINTLYGKVTSGKTAINLSYAVEEWGN